MKTDSRALEIVGRSGAFAIRGSFDIAEAMLRTGDQNHPFVLFIQCFGDYPPILNYPVYEGQELDGKTLHFRCEWGLGDQILFVRFARAFKERGARVIISCDKGLVPLFKPLGETVPRSETFKVKADYWMPSLSCPRWFPVTGEPYLQADPLRLNDWGWKDKIAGGCPRVGIRWSGNPNYPMEYLRRFPAELMIDLHKLRPDVQFYSFQRDDNLRDLPRDIIDLKDDLKTWDDTAAAMACMDLMISSDTGLAHLAAAIGKPIWIVVPLMPGWQWAMPGEKTPWYDSVRLFRQEAFREWEVPFVKLAEALRQWNAGDH
jgi:hypothetical protein